jgi:hypothetical protein
LQNYFSELKDRGIEQNRWESADRYQMISSMYEPNWTILFFSGKHAVAATIAAGTWTRNSKQKWCSWKFYSQPQKGVSTISNSNHHSETSMQMFTQVWMTLHKSRWEV